MQNKLSVMLGTLLLSLLFAYPLNSGEIKKGDAVTKNKIVLSDIDKEKEGMRIHLRILNKYKKIDVFYRGPAIWGALTEKPLAIISVPKREWEKLSEKECDYLMKYAASMVKLVKIDPFKYSGVSRNAPLASRIRNNVENMNDNSWGIMAGRISEDGRDILSDKLVRSGN